MKTIAEHMMAMRAAAFVGLRHNERTALWEGILSPSGARDYNIRVAYATPILGEVFTIGRVQPQVRVMSPLLERHYDYEQGPIPHVYWDNEDYDHPVLCLFSLEGREWGLDDLIAETTILWASRWLYFYEGWLATKKWKGGGRHPGRHRDGKRLATV
ncbi:MAG TPA: hypothetical protein VGL97_02145 [Bryobacteraceae bacterium]|jgi:hypothetical protein